MTRLLTLAVLLFVATFDCTSAQAQAATGTPVGRWLTQSGNLEIDIAACGTALCGTVVRVLGNQSMSAPGTEMKSADGKNPLGLKILTGLTPSDDGEWEGQIYNRENGKTYDCVVNLAAPNQLEVRGYVFLQLFGKTQVWTRVTG